jgi:hypothetical protein
MSGSVDLTDSGVVVGVVIWETESVCGAGDVTSDVGSGSTGLGGTSTVVGDQVRTAIVIAVRAGVRCGTAHVASDFSTGHKEEENDTVREHEYHF